MEHTVLCADSLTWLDSALHHQWAPPRSHAACTSLPDYIETPLDDGDYELWYVRACSMLMRLASPALFYQTDRKRQGRWLSKPLLLARAAELAGAELVWHKVVCRREPGKADLHRPGYAHLLAYGQPGCRPGRARADVVPPSAGLYRNGMPWEAARLAASYVAEVAPGAVLLDPFCGRGTVLAAGAAEGLSTLGIDHSEEQCAHARATTATLRQPVVAS